jgi:hypothetical protein
LKGAGVVQSEQQRRMQIVEELHRMHSIKMGNAMESAHDVFALPSEGGLTPGVCLLVWTPRIGSLSRDAWVFTPQFFLACAEAQICVSARAEDPRPAAR